MPDSELVCPACERAHPLAPRRALCDCGELLELSHPAPSISRADLFAPGAESGVWRYRTLIDPGSDPARTVSLCEGDTPLLRAPRAARWAGMDELLVKHEGRNPTGSFKDRGMTVAVGRARDAGARRLACASTGNTAASLAAYAGRAGLEAVILAPESGTAKGKLVQALAHGARALLVRGDFDDAMRLARGLSDAGELSLVNSIDPFRLEGQKTIPFEILAALGWQAPDWLAFPAGNLGNCAAFGKALRELRAWGWIDRAPRLLAVQAAGSAPFAAAFERGFDRLEPVRAETLASAIRIGAPVSYARAVRSLSETGGRALAVSDAELLEAKEVLDREGVGCEPASAAGLAGVRRMAREGRIGPSERVVCVLTGHLLKDVETTLAWHEGRLGSRPGGSSAGVQVVDPDLAAARRALDRSPASD